MNQSDPLIRDISDTALWAAAFRARETERPDAVYRDPFAAKLAGERGTNALNHMPAGTSHAWAWVTRTFLFDHFIMQRVRAGTDVVVNLAAGLDARPYRMELPSSLRWVEVDLPHLIAYKEEVLRNDRPRCRLERVALDLSDVAARRALLERIGRDARNGLVITEGILIYLERAEVETLAREIAGVVGAGGGAGAGAPGSQAPASGGPAFTHWVLEVASPGLLRMLQKNIGVKLSEAGAPLKFAPEEGPEFFAPAGWRPADVKGMIKAAAKIRRLPWKMRPIAWLPEPRGWKAGNRPWSGVCLMEKA